MIRISTLGWGLYCGLGLLTVAFFFAGALVSFVRLVEPQGPLLDAAGFSVLALLPALLTGLLTWALGRVLNRA